MCIEKVGTSYGQCGRRCKSDRTEVHISESSLVVQTLYPKKQGLVSLSRQSYALTRHWFIRRKMHFQLVTS